MKNVTFAALLCLSGCTGLIVEDKTPITATYVHDVSVEKNKVFVKTIEWASKNFVSAKDVIQLQDKDSGKIVIHATLLAVGKFADPLEIPFSMHVDIKDGKYRTQFEDLRDHHSGFRQTVFDRFKEFDGQLFTFIHDTKADNW